MKAVSWVNCILGLWLIVSGFVLSSAARPVMTEEIVIGIVIACLAVISTARPSPAISWLVAIAGLWALLGPAVIGYTPAMIASHANDSVVGIVVLILGIANGVDRRTPARVGA